MAGCQVEYGEERLHQFVRAIEALIKPEEGKTTKQFAYRTQTFVRSGSTLAEDLKEIFKLRCAAVHLNEFEGVLDGYPACDRERIAALRVFQAESIAHTAYARILGKPDLLQNFIDDNSINAFWQGPDDRTRRQSWGEPLDLAAEETDHFRWH